MLLMRSLRMDLSQCPSFFFFVFVRDRALGVVCELKSGVKLGKLYFR